MHKIRYVVLPGLIVLALCCTIGITGAQAEVRAVGVPDDIPLYNGSFGPDNPLYGLKIGMENLDETFTFNESERLEKKIDHANLRIAEVKGELARNRPDVAERALDQYREKLNQTEISLAPNTTGLLHAQEMIIKHQTVLENLLLLHPNNTGLMQAYNNSLILEQKFENKTAILPGNQAAAHNKTIFKEPGSEMSDQNRTAEKEQTQTMKQEAKELAQTEKQELKEQTRTTKQEAKELAQAEKQELKEQAQTTKQEAKELAQTMKQELKEDNETTQNITPFFTPIAFQSGESPLTPTVAILSDDQGNKNGNGKGTVKDKEPGKSGNK